MNLGFGLGLPFPQKVGSAPPAADYPAEMQAILTAKNGFALDAEDLATLFKDAGITPVAVNADPVGRWVGKWGTSGNPTFNQVTAGNQPAWNSTGSLALATDDRVFTGAGYTPFISLNSCHFGIRAMTTSLAAAQTLFSFSATLGTATRSVFTVNADGSISAAQRRLNADGLTTVTTAAGLVTANVPFTLQVENDYVATTISVILNGSVVASGNFGASGQSDSDVSGSTKMTVGATVSATQFWNGNIGNASFVCGSLTAGQKASAKGWLELTL